LNSIHKNVGKLKPNGFRLYDVNGNTVRAIFVDYVLQLETSTSIAKVFIA
jgi:hypothetical protein